MVGTGLRQLPQHGGQHQGEGDADDDKRELVLLHLFAAPGQLAGRQLHRPGQLSHPAGVHARRAHPRIDHLPADGTAEQLIERLLPEIDNMRVGISTDEQAHYGPVVTAAHRQRIIDYIAAVQGQDMAMLYQLRSGRLPPPGIRPGLPHIPAIWEDRAGFEKALATWSEAVDAAIAANPQTVEETKPVAGPIFNSCKGCHDDYRIEDE